MCYSALGAVARQENENFKNRFLHVLLPVLSNLKVQSMRQTVDQLGLLNGLARGAKLRQYALLYVWVLCKTIHVERT